MFEQLPNKRPFSQGPGGRTEVRDVDYMLLVVNNLKIIVMEWSEHAHSVGVVGPPMNALLDET